MAVKLIAEIAKYVGSNSDAKPTSVPIGSLFSEHDTGFAYINYNGTNWALLPTYRLDVTEEFVERGNIIWV